MARCQTVSNFNNSRTHELLDDDSVFEVSFATDETSKPVPLLLLWRDDWCFPVFFVFSRVLQNWGWILKPVFPKLTPSEPTQIEVWKLLAIIYIQLPWKFFLAPLIQFQKNFAHFKLYYKCACLLLLYGWCIFHSEFWHSFQTSLVLLLNMLQLLILTILFLRIGITLVLLLIC